MLSQKYRFHGHGSLRYLYRNGGTVRNRSLLLKYVENKHRANSRIAVVVGKKVAKSAVTRNRIRRRVFEIIRHHLPNIKSHHDLSLTVFTAEFATLPFKDLEQDVITLLSQAHLYTKPQPTSVPEDK
ncbi:MAG TPA: ribonuclease P protein component [Candidatus Saccharibacteria bacterium]|nr:ribonuclease P protein component [Candidatus Saccharibacteria bacterium]